MTYIEKLRDPRWQKKRLEIMSRDNFQCALCNTADTTLSVHHFYYISNRNPWDYPDLSMHTVCKDCHSQLHDNQSDLNSQCSWEVTASIEIFIQNKLLSQNIRPFEDGSLGQLCKASFKSEMKGFDFIKLLVRAANCGVISKNWIGKLKTEVELIEQDQK